MKRLIIPLMFLFVLLVTPLKSDGPVIPVSQGKKACTFAVGFKNLKVYYEKVLVVAEKPALDEDGNARPEWWILNLENPQKHQRDKNGLPIALNVPKDEVLFADPKDGPVVVMHRMKVCKCPPMYWSAVAPNGWDAEHK